MCGCSLVCVDVRGCAWLCAYVCVCVCTCVSEGAGAHVRRGNASTHRYRAEVIESGDELNNGATECCKWIGSRGLLQRRVGNKRIGTKGSVSDRGYCGKVG